MITVLPSTRNLTSHIPDLTVLTKVTVSTLSDAEKSERNTVLRESPSLTVSSPHSVTAARSSKSTRRLLLNMPRLDWQEREDTSNPRGWLLGLLRCSTLPMSQPGNYYWCGRCEERGKGGKLEDRQCSLGAWFQRWSMETALVYFVVVIFSLSHRSLFFDLVLFSYVFGFFYHEHMHGSSVVIRWWLSIWWVILKNQNWSFLQFIVILNLLHWAPQGAVTFTKA